MSDTAALIVAAGRGERLPGDRPKQYRNLAGLPVLRRSVNAFARHEAISQVQIVFNQDDAAYYANAVGDLDLPPPVAGGATRQESVRNGLNALRDFSANNVLIHDGARPIVSSELIDRVVTALGNNPGAVPAIAESDTLKRAENKIITGTVDRSGLWRAQTPQGFHLDAILRAHDEAVGEYTDDASIAEAAGIPVALVEGAAENIKITTEDDLAQANRWLAGAMETRVGTGFDVHRFEAGDHVRLAGIDIAHDQALAGHSDADVVLHAITDAILGALGAGDIGQHFPPSDPAWRDADSAQFLRHATNFLSQQDGHINHVDITVICERPKISPHREPMISNIAQLLGVSSSRVSVKATTTEGLGFTGRGEGIAAQAVATIALPQNGDEQP